MEYAFGLNIQSSLLPKPQQQQQQQTRLSSKVFSLGQILNKPEEKEEKIVFGFPLHRG